MVKYLMRPQTFFFTFLQHPVVVIYITNTVMI